MIKYGINNIRDLFGYKVNLKMVRNNPIARYLHRFIFQKNDIS